MATKQPKVKKATDARKAKRATKTAAQLAAEDKARADKATVEKRVESMVNAILEGRRTPSIIANAMKQWGVSNQQAYKYYHAALKRIRAEFDDKLPDYIKAHLTRLEFIYKTAMDRQELKPALAAMKQISDLLGLDAPKEFKGTMGFEGLTDATDEQLAKIITAGAAAASGSGHGTNRATRG